MNNETEFTEDESRFLLFRIGGELYGTPLLGVREVVEPQHPKPIPNTRPFFSGVINIRGEIVGVIDLRVRFNQPAQESRGMALMVFDSKSGPMACLVDKVEAVEKIPDTEIKKQSGVHTIAAPEYLIGIAHCNERLVTLIDLNGVMGAVEVGIGQATV